MAFNYLSQKFMLEVEVRYNSLYEISFDFDLSLMLREDVLQVF